MRFLPQAAWLGKAQFIWTFCIENPDRLVLLFMQEEDYVPSVWLEKPGKQQKQMHFDFQVPDVAAAVQCAQSIGAKISEAQFGGNMFIPVFDTDEIAAQIC